MGKLKNLRPSLGMLRPTVAFMPEGEQQRDKARASLEWRKWYNSTRWRKLAAAVKLRDLFTCQMPGCGRVGGRLVADHKRPHRGAAALFWDITNIWTLCKPCHDGAKQREEARDRASGR
jgi:5-methylcytosine-specific restriction protein A